MKAPVSWLREWAGLPADASVDAVARRIADGGFEIAAIDGETVDFEITANRPDCLSIRGLAREAAVAFRVDVPSAPAPAVDDARPAAVRVEIASPLCRRFALAMADVSVGPSPEWLAARLTACGVRPINNVVDVTNYVMLELGQPLHAYDAAKIAGGVLVARPAQAGETLTTLDLVDRTLDPTMLIIADGAGPSGIAGVMGGAASEVSPDTRRIALEAAWFQPATVRATSKKLGLKTEASTRFERGADIDTPPAAIDRAIALLERIGAGRRASATTDLYPAPVVRGSVPLRRERVHRLLGDAVPDAEILDILMRLGFTIAGTAPEWIVGVPSWRVDVDREADLIEEIGRHWGVNRVPPSFPALRVAPRPSDAGVLRARRLRRLLCGAGLQEAVTFTFMEAAAAAPFAPAGGLVTIANPLSEKFAVLRPSLIPGLIDAVAYNRRRGIDEVRLFEAGAVFAANGESQRVAWVLAGPRAAHWSQSNESVDAWDATGIGALIADAWHLPIDVAPTGDARGFLRGRVAALSSDGTRIGTAGQIDPALLDARGLPAGSVVVAGECDLAALTGDGTLPRPITPLPRFPAVVRDLSLLVDATLSAAAVRATIRRPHGRDVPMLADVREFDRYQGKGVPDGRVSLACRLTFRDPSRTLTDQEVDAAMDDIMTALREVCGAVIRGR